MSALFSRQRKPEPATPTPPVAVPTGEARPAASREPHAVRERRWVLHPLHTEKATRLEGEGTYTFVVDRRATKPAVRREIETRYKVNVRRVRIVRIPALRTARGGRITRRKHGVKKAIVTLEKGHKIEERGEEKT